MQILNNFPLKSLNSFGVEANAQSYVRIDRREDLLDLAALEPLHKRPHLVLGGGSNVLFTRDFPGLIIHMNNLGMEVVEETSGGVLVSAESGMPWDDLVATCVNKGWNGLENLSLIPGSVGAAPIQNIGAYGAEIKDCFHSLECFEKSSGQVRIFFAADCRFGYRDSYFKQQRNPDHVILGVKFQLGKDPYDVRLSYRALREELLEKGIQRPSIAQAREAVIAIRRRKLPDPAQMGNAGSFFKNPVVSDKTYLKLQKMHPNMPAWPDMEGMKLAAGWLIEQCGWKGKQEQGAGVHHEQALVIVNHGQASGMDVLRLAERIKASVHKRFQIDLIPEVRIY